ncbi:hypothetical protein [Paenibacillus wynnii]|uniref:Uncharacterized protein n=1 Tax=Paenibacillus wynnii TaxID=268407 RepID=A0A098MCB4_9BACL|nr:hypothetical protein [Paenibacillus wynnii]KGE20194.1 hypothetical protein PWYN_13285 [Paenibacillus wynnii]
MISPFFKKKDSMEKDSKSGMGQKLQPVVEPEEEQDELDTVEALSGLISTGKAQLDKKSLDLIFAVEQIIQSRQHAETNSHELQDRLTHSTGHVERLNRDMKNLNKVIEEKEKNILELEHKLIEKNLKVDQVIEDYRELQTTMAAEIDELKSSIDLEQQKYVSVVQKHNEAHSDKLKKINDLEEKLGRVEVENSHLKQKYDTIRQEKAYLSSMISDFTNRMTLPFGNNTLTERKDGNGDT